MGYWEGKCFFCYWFGTLALIVTLSVHSISKDKKEKKHVTEQVKTNYRDSL